MGGLSSDPAKAQRQRDALAAGRRKLAENLLNGGGGPPPAKAPPKTKAKAPAKASKSKSRTAADPDRVRYDRSQRAPAQRASERSRDRRDDPPRRRGFFDGLLGRID